MRTCKRVEKEASGLIVDLPKIQHTDSNWNTSNWNILS